MALIDYSIVIFFGALVGAGELVSRYRAAPVSALRTGPAILYITINAVGAGAALFLIRAFGWEFGLSPQVSDGAAVRWTQVLIAGFGAMTFFRSSLFTVRAGDQDVSIGPTGFLQIILSAADRAVDRRQARVRAKLVAPIMQGVSFDKAYAVLPMVSLGLMQNVSAEEQDRLAREVARIKGAEGVDDAQRAVNLGIVLLNVLGADALEAAVEILGDGIRT